METDLDHVLVAERLVELIDRYSFAYDINSTKSLLLVAEAINHLAMQCIHETPGPKGRRYILARELRGVAARIQYKLQNQSESNND